MIIRGTGDGEKERVINKMIRERRERRSSGSSDN
jgi:hypothetical protein